MNSINTNHNDGGGYTNGNVVALVPWAGGMGGRQLHYLPVDDVEDGGTLGPGFSGQSESSTD
jgi:hypothetical protein